MNPGDSPSLPYYSTILHQALLNLTLPTLLFGEALSSLAQTFAFRFSYFCRPANPAPDINALFFFLLARGLVLCLVPPLAIRTARFYKTGLFLALVLPRPRIPKH